jgi:hypothetical protein
MKFSVNMGKIIIGQIYTNETRPQTVEILRVGRNLQRPMDKEVDFTSKVEYKVIKATSKNPMSEFICTEERFLRLYRL